MTRSCSCLVLEGLPASAPYNLPPGGRGEAPSIKRVPRQGSPLMLTAVGSDRWLGLCRTIRRASSFFQEAFGACGSRSESGAPRIFIQCFRLSTRI